MSVLYHVWGVRRLLLLIQNALFQAAFGTRFKNRVSIFGFPIVSLAKSSRIIIGKNLVLISHSYFSAPGVNHPVIIRTLKPGARLAIGDNVGISGGAICVAQEVLIGSNVMLGANVTVTDTDFHPIRPEGRRYSADNIPTGRIVIEDNVFVGMNASILKGVKIGQNAVIGAGAVVTTDIPPYCIAAGIPAKVIGYL